MWDCTISMFQNKVNFYKSYQRKIKADNFHPLVFVFEKLQGIKENIRQKLQIKIPEWMTINGSFIQKCTAIIYL